jgi:hypothetical protein
VPGKIFGFDLQLIKIKRVKPPRAKTVVITSFLLPRLKRKAFPSLINLTNTNSQRTKSLRKEEKDLQQSKELEKKNQMNSKIKMGKLKITNCLQKIKRFLWRIYRKMRHQLKIKMMVMIKCRIEIDSTQK